MEKEQYIIFPLIQIFPDENKNSFWANSFIQDMRIVASINYYKTYYRSGIILVPDMNNLPATKYLCSKSNLKIYEYYHDEPAKLAEGIDIYIKKNATYGFIILQYIAPKIDLISSLLVSKGFEVVDKARRYPELHESGVMTQRMERSIIRNGRCPQCGSENLIYQEGAVICLNCCSSMEG